MSHARPIQPARPARTINARSSISFGACPLRGSRTAGGPSRFETQGCTADGTADGPDLWRAAASAIMWERTKIPARLAAPPPRPTRGPAARSVTPRARRSRLARAHVAHRRAASSGASFQFPRPWPHLQGDLQANGRPAPHPPLHSPLRACTHLHALRAPLLRRLLNAHHYADCFSRMRADLHTDLQACPAKS